MTSQPLDNAESQLSAIETLLQSHDSSMHEHSTQLSFLLMNVTELLKFIASLCTEVHESIPRSSGSPSSNDAPHSTESPSSDDPRLLTKRVKIPPFTGEDPIGWIAKAEIYFAV